MASEDVSARSTVQRTEGNVRFTIAPAVALVALRIASSWNWINGAFLGHDQKVGIYFLSGKFLVARIEGPGGFAHSAVYPSIGHWVGTSVVHDAVFFAWVIFLGEAVAGISLLLGLFTRVGGLAAVLSAIANLIAAGGNGADTLGQNYLLLLLGVIFIVVGAGRWFGVDAWLQRRYPNARWLRLVG